MNLHSEILYSNLCLSWLGVSLCSAYGYIIFTEFGGGFFLLSALLFWVFFFLHRTLYTFVNVRGTVSKHGFFLGMVTVTCQAYQIIKCQFHLAGEKFIG